MATKQEIYEGVRGVEERLERLLPGIAANLERPLPTGTWTIHDALCHIAADGNAVPRFVQRMERIDRGEPGRPPGFNVDEHNEQQIALRKGRTVDEVVTEIKGGFAADLAAVESIPDATLERQIPGFGGNLTLASDSLRFNLVGHNHLHLDDIEKALQV
ncbi:MAG TPA: maleylpyruvate isomerase N-terminal domain-containing protein [Dehalococcoidia bacterium]|nr:maleylpyruvate isomerase N-terminal domain-containing protein [Dehalococcoidia bacterium]